MYRLYHMAPPRICIHAIVDTRSKYAKTYSMATTKTLELN